ncbi:MAG TPA: DUF362 domain-containing protein [Deltaproteobacteria bacterium]|nr:DUF362 domain-containing protein [Deltaproteobacteria bacterium]
MADVLVRKASYNYPELKSVLFEMIEALAGEKIKSGCRVLIKPNLLSAAAPENAILTHPLVIKAAVEYVLEKGARPQVSDSPAIGSFERILKMNEIKEALKGLDVICSPFKNTVMVDIGKPYGKIEIAQDAVEADVIINLPKLKTHTQMLLTLAVKNMFGCIVGFKKSQWHMRAGSDTDAFARLLIAIHQTVKPTVSILDGILALEGEGPGKGGKPRQIGVLMGSDDSFALDMAVCQMLGISYASAPILKNAEVMGLLPAFKVTGDMPLITDFQLPPASGLIWGPRFLHNFLRRHTMALPVCDDNLCEMCSQCWTLCPAKAIEPLAEKIKFDYKKCIRCYCCIEVCPYGALHAQETIGGKITRKLMNKFS